MPLYQTRFVGEPTGSDRSAERLIRSYLEQKNNLSKDELVELSNQAKQNNIIIISNEEYIKKAEVKSAIVGIGIRASNKLCSAKKNNDAVDHETKRLLREEVLAKYGFHFEKDITSSIPRVAYALNHGGWLKDDVDLYKKIYREVEPNGSKEDFRIEREAIKKLFFRVYFDSTDNKLAFHTWNHMTQDRVDRDSVYRDMINLRRAMEKVLGKQRYDNYIFYVESCIYIDTLHSLLAQGYKVWLVYDCFYGAGFGTQEEFEKMVLEAVWVSFVRFKSAYDFNEWKSILEKTI